MRVDEYGWKKVKMNESGESGSKNGWMKSKMSESDESGWKFESWWKWINMD